MPHEAPALIAPKNTRARSATTDTVALLTGAPASRGLLAPPALELALLRRIGRECPAAPGPRADARGGQRRHCNGRGRGLADAASCTVCVGRGLGVRRGGKTVAIMLESWIMITQA